ncbi:MAG: hypothetical protein LBH22_00735 [Bacteroidales bacterium]|jgi:hypothetical protein|nr:hypothetical protein [Bacteroidales bacterium]
MKKKTTHTRIKEQRQYQKIGRLRKSIADKIGKPAADIYIDDNHLKHIFNQHKNELAKIGLTPLMFVNLVIDKFNRIYKQESRQSFFLVQWNCIAKVTVIELNFAFKNGFYEIKTAFTRDKKNFKKENLIWEKK